MPIPRVRPTGVTEIEEIVGAVTVKVVDCDRPLKLAEMVVVPATSEFTRPAELTVAVALEDEFQETKFVRSALLPSL